MKLFTVLSTCLISGLQDLREKKYQHAAASVGIFTSMLTWGLGSRRFTYLIIMIAVVFVGLISGRVDRSGCLLVAIGIFFAYGNHHSDTNRWAIDQATHK